MKSLGFFLLFTIVIYLAINYANITYSRDKTETIVKSVPLPTYFGDYFVERSLVDDFAQMFGRDEEELNLFNSSVELSNKKNKKLYVPQRFFVNI
jgi:hypothetical protein